MAEQTRLILTGVGHKRAFTTCAYKALFPTIGMLPVPAAYRPHRLQPEHPPKNELVLVPSNSKRVPNSAALAKVRNPIEPIEEAQRKPLSTQVWWQLRT